MKTYFNKHDLDYHLYLFALQGSAEELYESKDITFEEKRYLKAVIDNAQKFHISVINRLGNAYAKRLNTLVNFNEVKLVRKTQIVQQPITECTGEAWDKIIESTRNMNCLLCEKENHKDCELYQAFVAYGLDGNNKDDGCPFGL